MREKLEGNVKTEQSKQMKGSRKNESLSKYIRSGCEE